MKNTLIINLVWLIVLGVSVSITYSMAKSSYRDVGLGDGQILAKENLIKSLKKIKPIESCNSLDKAGLQEVVSVKTTGLYVISSADNSFHFCIME